MFINRTGDIFTTICKTIVIPVNMVGVMGAGLALECKLRYPEVFENYVEQCKKSTLWPILYTFKNREKNILLFPTKRNFKNKSSIDLIKEILGLMNQCNEPIINYYESLAIPKLGCGLGGLDWKEVKPIIISGLNNLSQKINIELWE